jgi:hypothetical protein
MRDEASDARARRWTTRIVWLAVIWAASVSVLALGAYALRFVMGWAGLTR